MLVSRSEMERVCVLDASSFPLCGQPIFWNARARAFVAKVQTNDISPCSPTNFYNPPESSEWLNS